ncbi:hypothetical protein [Alicyclobacillus fodiniaquatilis]|uniref:Uncharacterized protein n=1 Tax=Alicyclobacillus fodiniaquatilis TaxID=1661150 RepID=A0ABW4JSP0_9BACL
MLNFNDYMKGPDVDAHEVFDEFFGSDGITFRDMKALSELAASKYEVNLYKRLCHMPMKIRMFFAPYRRKV